MAEITLFYTTFYEGVLIARQGKLATFGLIYGVNRGCRGYLFFRETKNV